MSGFTNEAEVRSRVVDGVAVVYVSSYLNKLAGERIERECRRQIKAGCRAIVLDFQAMGIVNSVGVSILLGIIEAAKESGAELVFCAVGEQNLTLFEMMGLTPHIGLAADEQSALEFVKEKTTSTRTAI
jgi:anti-anti-sigma factor